MKYLSSILLIAVMLTGVVNISAQTDAYRIFNANGKKVSFKKMIKELAKSDVVLFGEQHDNPISHWLQLETTMALHNANQLVLGAEMFERDNQDELDAYLAGEITYEGLDSTTRLWGNYKTDYAPLVDFAKDNGLRFIGTNIPRRYASLVYKNGGFEALDSLSAEEKSWIAPLPIPFDPNLPKYQGILEMMGDHGSPDLVKAQASKDATMAHFILDNYRDGEIFIHFNGAYHSDHYEGILWYLQRSRPDLKYVTISSVTQDNTTKLNKEHRGTADFIICIDEQMTRTYAQ